MKPKALVLASRSPYPLDAGFRMRFHFIAQQLARRYDVDLLALAPVRPPGGVAVPFGRIVEFPVSRAAFLRRAARRWLTRGWPLQVGGYLDAAAQAWLDRHAGDYDLLYVHHVRMAPYAAHRPGFRVLDFHDAISMHYLGARDHAAGLWGPLYRLEGPRMLRCETAALGAFSGTLVVSQADRDWLLDHAPPACPTPVEVIPMAVRPECLAYPLPAERPWIVMIGNLGYHPNADAASHFALDVFPLVRRARPDAELYLVGGRPTAAVRRLGRLPGVHVTGYVTDPYAYLARAGVVVAPMRLGAGIQNKVLEGMALGRAVVGTPLALRGIAGAEHATHVWIATDPADMAAAICTLLGDPERRARLGAAARDLMLERYTWERVGDRLLDLLDRWTP